jgi:hypothetical protein
MKFDIPSQEKQLDFAVGLSRQPLPSGNHFAIVTTPVGPRIMATDAPDRVRLELAKLRPETLEPSAKLSPTALFTRWAICAARSPVGSTPEDGQAGLKKNHKRGETKAARFVAPRGGRLSETFLARSLVT